MTGAAGAKAMLGALVELKDELIRRQQKFLDAQVAAEVALERVGETLAYVDDMVTKWSQEADRRERTESPDVVW